MYLNHTPPLNKHAHIRAIAGPACTGRPAALGRGIALLFGSAAA